MISGKLGGPEWRITVLAREILSPSPYLAQVETVEILPKARVVLRILSDLTSIPMSDPVLHRCLVSIAAPCAATSSPDAKPLRCSTSR